MSNDFFDDYTTGGIQSREVTTRIEDEFKTDVAFRFGIIGVGQCGNNLAAAFYKQGYRRILLVNSAQPDMEAANELAGGSLKTVMVSNDGRGTGKDQEAGRELIENNGTEILSAMNGAFGEDVDKVIVCYSLGGGTGGGGGPEVVKIAQSWIKEKGGSPSIDVIVIYILPEPAIDGPSVCSNALNSYIRTVKLGVPTAGIDNAMVRLACNKPSLKYQWPAINGWIARTLHAFNVYSAMKSTQAAFDGNEYNDVLSRGSFVFTCFYMNNLDRPHEAVKTMSDYLKQSLFASTKLTSASAAACLIVLNSKTSEDYSVESIEQLLSALNAMMQSNNAKHGTLHRGIYYRDIPPLGGQDIDMFCYVMLGGLSHSVGKEGVLTRLFEKSKESFPQYATVEAMLTVELQK